MDGWMGGKIDGKMDEWKDGKIVSYSRALFVSHVVNVCLVVVFFDVSADGQPLGRIEMTVCCIEWCTTGGVLCGWYV